MNRIACTVTIFTLLGCAAPAQTVIPRDSIRPSGVLAGAYQPVPVDEAKVQDAKAFAQSRLPFLTLVDVNVAYAQVVQGWNVKFITTGVEDGRQVTWKFVVYRDLDGQMALSMAERL